MKQKHFLISLLILTSCGNPNKEIPLNERYPMPWRNPDKDEFIGIGAAFAKNNVKICGEYYIRPSKKYVGEFLVACTPDGKNYQYFLVWGYTSKIMGPYRDSTLMQPDRNIIK